ncbi:hypothetical protein [Microbispora sp. H10836]|uniref:hypothetical protein n=1 Tax=Microbispora sp. H10836 TaxID=2729106 RepID=UPI0014736773|nr:hypothetical protein [Microbispora sp. H10836]
MRIRTLVTGLGLAAGLVVPAGVSTPAHAVTAATACTVELNSIYAGNVDEKDGRDELRFRVDGNLFPRVNSKYSTMTAGDTDYGSDFEDPTTIVDPTHSASFNLREVTPPAAGSGTSLGSATADWSDCDTLDVGEWVDLPSQKISGTDETYYDYRVVLRVTGI